MTRMSSWVSGLCRAGVRPRFLVCRGGGLFDSLLVYAKGGCQHGAYGFMRNRIRRLTALARSLNSEPIVAQCANTRFLARPDVRVRPAMPNSTLADRAHRTPPRR